MTQPVLKNEVTDLTPEKGLKREQRLTVADALGDSLADAFRLHFNVQTLHWNVEGPMFFSVHKLTEEHYEALGESVDEIAERVRALGLPAPSTLTEFDERSALGDLPSDGSLKERIARLVGDYETAGERLKEVVDIAENNNDIKTADLLTAQLGQYDEYAWMLRATIAS